MLHKAISNLKNQDGEGEGGFTLIELLVVILIIGILAAIALPTFLGQSDKAKDSEAKSDARNAVTQVESCLVDERGANAASCATSPQVDLGSTIDATSGVSVTSADEYTIAAESETGTFFVIKKAAGEIAKPYECGSTAALTGAASGNTKRGEGGCNSAGTW